MFPFHNPLFPLSHYFCSLYTLNMHFVLTELHPTGAALPRLEFVYANAFRIQTLPGDRIVFRVAVLAKALQVLGSI